MVYIETGYPVYNELLSFTGNFARGNGLRRIRKSERAPEFKSDDRSLAIKLGFLPGEKYLAKGETDLDKRFAWVDVEFAGSVHLNKDGFLVPFSSDQDLEGVAVAAEYVLALKKGLGNRGMDVDCVGYWPHDFKRRGKVCLEYVTDCDQEAMRGIVSSALKPFKLVHRTAWGSEEWGNQRFGIEMEVKPGSEPGSLTRLVVTTPGFIRKSGDSILLPKHPRDWRPVVATTEGLKVIQSEMGNRDYGFECSAMYPKSAGPSLFGSIRKNKARYKVSLK